MYKVLILFIKMKQLTFYIGINNVLCLIISLISTNQNSNLQMCYEFVTYNLWDTMPRDVRIFEFSNSLQSNSWIKDWVLSIWFLIKHLGTIKLRKLEVTSLINKTTILWLKPIKEVFTKSEKSISIKAQWKLTDSNSFITISQLTTKRMNLHFFTVVLIML